VKKDKHVMLPLYEVFKSREKEMVISSLEEWGVTV
jgi:hypothetical protein